MKLERKVLYFCYSHGVVAVVSEETMEYLVFCRSLKKEIWPKLFACVASRIYTFSDSSYRRQYVHGPLRLLEALVKSSGVTLKRASFYVPFSQPEVDEGEQKFRAPLIPPRALLQDFGLERWLDLD